MSRNGSVWIELWNNEIISAPDVVEVLDALAKLEVEHYVRTELAVRRHYMFEMPLSFITNIDGTPGINGYSGFDLTPMVGEMQSMYIYLLVNPDVGSIEKDIYV